MNINLRKVFLTVFSSSAIIFGSLGASQEANAYSQLIIFGDSLSDTGNISQITGGIPLPPYFNGRYSNGPTYSDVLASGLGLSSLHSLAGGSNYAISGATVISDGSGISLTDQAANYFSLNPTADAEALYVVWGGGNDIRASISNADAEAAANGIINLINDLINAGATNFLVPNLPDIGDTPLIQGGGGPTPSDATDRTLLFNNTLSSGLDSLSGANIFSLDVYALTLDTITNPSTYGLTNVDDPCYTGSLLGGSGTVCSNPDEYLYWDEFHPTAAAHETLGQAALAAVIPLPGSSWLFLSALTALLYHRQSKGSMQLKSRNRVT